MISVSIHLVTLAQHAALTIPSPSPTVPVVEVAPHAVGNLTSGAVTIICVIITGVLGTIGTVLTALVKSRNQSRADVGKVGDQVDQVLRNTQPIANGFTSHTSETLARIEGVIGRVSERTTTIEAALITHLGDHVHGGAGIVPRQNADMSPATEVLPVTQASPVPAAMPGGEAKSRRGPRRPPLPGK